MNLAEGHEMDSGLGAALASTRVEQTAHTPQPEALGRLPGMAFLLSLAAALNGWEAVWTTQPL